MKNASSQNSVDGMRIIASCPWCLVPDVAANAKEVRSAGDHHLFYLLCPSCKNAILAMVESGKVGMSCIGVVTDMSLENLDLLLEAPALGVDDVLEIHSALNRSRFLASVLEKRAHRGASVPDSSDPSES